MKNIEDNIKANAKSTPSVDVGLGILDFGTAAQTEIQNLKFEIKMGDCIDCTLCVQVCPTGIDIRNGTQLECTNCTACMDACDAVMLKINRPTGLIRYDSLNGIKNGKRRIFTGRVAAYSVVLMALLSLDIGLLTNRADIGATILRSTGIMYQTVDNDHFTNLILFKLSIKRGIICLCLLKLKKI